MKAWGWKSLRTRLALDFAVLALMLVLGSVAAIYHSYRSYRDFELDQQLRRSLQFLRLTCVAGPEAAAVTLPAETRVPAPADGMPQHWFEVRSAGGETLYRSADLQGLAPLPILNGTLAQPVFHDQDLSSGEPVRVVGQWIIPPLQIGASRSDRAAPEVHLTAAVSRKDIIEDLIKVRRVIYLAVGTILVLLAGLGAWLVHRALRPLQSLSEELSRIPVGGPSRFSVPLNASELEPVVGRLNDLMERVSRALARERGFATDAAHELRTPLAGLRARLELALSRPRSSAEYRAELGAALEIEHRLESMVSHLLLLARLGPDSHWSFIIKPINIGRLLGQCWGEFFDRAEERRLCVSLRVAEGGAELQSSEDLVRLLIRNLFDNTVSYTPVGGVIEITADPTPQGWEITVSNTNPGLHEADLVHLAEPFWRARHEEAVSDGRHVGLGLSLCQRITDELGGTLEHSLTDGGLVRAHLVLPGRVPDPSPSRR